MGNKKRYLSVVSIVFALLASILLVSCQKKEQAASTKVVPIDIEILKSRLILETEENAETGAKVSRGTFAVFEDREAQLREVVSTLRRQLGPQKIQFLGDLGSRAFLRAAHEEAGGEVGRLTDLRTFVSGALVEAGRAVLSEEEYRRVAPEWQ